MVRVERSPEPPASLAVERQKASGSYRGDDVLAQLKADFHGKCYLCEIDELQSVEVEHLLPHHGVQDLDRKFDWDNLFFSCAHCNSVKNQKKYEDEILDCCKGEPEAALDQRFEDGHVSVTPTVDTPEARRTAALLTECFELINTGVRVIECQTRVKALSQTMALLYQSLERYQKSPSERYLRTLRGMLNRTYRFAGFTRAYIRAHLDKYPALAPFVALS